jgi:hypothetical protein
MAKTSKDDKDDKDDKDSKIIEARGAWFKGRGGTGPRK